MAEIGIGAVIGLVIGAVAGYFLVQFFLNKSKQQKIEELNSQADLQIKEARLSAKRIVDEAETKAEK